MLQIDKQEYFDVFDVKLNDVATLNKLKKKFSLIFNCIKYIIFFICLQISTIRAYKVSFVYI